MDYDRHPQKEKMQRYAESFQKLANSFYGMPCRKDYLSSSELKDLIEEAKEDVCRKCSLSQVCWTQHYPQTYQRLYGILRILEEKDEEKLRKARADLTGVCVNQGKLVQELGRIMDRERQNLIWNNKLLENRMAVAQQLGEMAQLMKFLSRDLFDLTEADMQLREDFARKLKKATYPAAESVDAGSAGREAEVLCGTVHQRRYLYPRKRSGRGSFSALRLSNDSEI